MRLALVAYVFAGGAIDDAASLKDATMPELVRLLASSEAGAVVAEIERRGAASVSLACEALGQTASGVNQAHVHYLRLLDGRKHAADYFVAAISKNRSSALFLAKAFRVDFGRDDRLWRKWLDTIGQDGCRDKILNRWRNDPMVEKSEKHIFNGLMVRLWRGESNEAIKRDVTNYVRQHSADTYGRHLEEIEFLQRNASILPPALAVALGSLQDFDDSNSLFSLRLALMDNEKLVSAVHELDDKCLIEMLDNRCPIGVLVARPDVLPHLVRLRAQDVAVEALGIRYQTKFYSPTKRPGYFSAEDVQARYELSVALRPLIQEQKGESDRERLFAVQQLLSNTYARLDVLETLGVRYPEYKNKVVQVLRSVYERCPVMWKPRIAELLLRFGDNSKVQSVLEMHKAGIFDKDVSPLADSATASIYRILDQVK